MAIRSITKMAGWICWIQVVLLAMVALVVPTTVMGFSNCHRACSRSTRSQQQQQQLFGQMTSQEIQEMMDTIPVYAVTEANQQGLVLLKEKNNPKDIAYFFFSPEATNTFFSPLREKTNGDWSVSAYPLGLVWFELLQKPEEGIEYRLVPEPEDLLGAQNLLKQTPNPELAKTLFQSSYNQIPVFVDQFLRVTTSEGDEKVPMYFSLKDLMGTVNQAIQASQGDYQAAMSAIDLKDLISTMMTTTTNEYRQAIFVPSTPSKQTEDDLSWEGKNTLGKKDTGPIATPTAADDLWD